jgi:plasmid stabilization system protein ParE
VVFRLTRHEDVRFDVAGILDLIGNYAGYRTGHEKVSAIQETLNQLRRFPHTGVLREDVAPGLRAIQSGSKAMICFKVDEKVRSVHIICVTYAGQDWQRIARDRSGA